MAELNPCEADRTRRERAAAGDTLIERTGNMERRITFQVGYDHTAHPEACGGGGHGRHGMTLRFVLKGPAGATQFVMNMPSWTPGNVDCIGGITNLDAPSAVAGEVPHRWPLLDDAHATDLGYHSPVPTYEGQEEYGDRECDLLDGGRCFYDGSGLNAEPILAQFLQHGPMAVWAALARYYAELFDTPQEAPT